MTIRPNGKAVFMHITADYLGAVQKFVSRIDRQLMVRLKECGETDKKRINVVLEEKIPTQSVLEEIVRIYWSVGWNVRVTDKGTFWVLTLHE